MSIKRLKIRVPSAKSISHGILKGHKLVFHKKSKDNSSKCDALKTNKVAEMVHGVLFDIDESDIESLNTAEGLGYGYEKNIIKVHKPDNAIVEAFTYIATDIDSSLLPYAWYKYHVIHSAVEHRLPVDYIAKIDEVETITDPDYVRARNELSIYHL